MMKLARAATILSALAALLLAAACNQTGGNANMGNRNANQSAALSDSDRNFMMKAASGGMMEVELGRLATQRAASADVKNFGQRMVDDHSKANDELKRLATQKGVTLPTQLEGEHKDTLDKLSKLSGADFDREYMETMVDDHTEDVSEFESQSTKANDPDLRAWVVKTLPTLRDHLQMARDVDAKVKGGTTTQANSNMARGNTNTRR
ncbi:MAG TPA: DUF4142 domain-containing protein [Blastocatellia bacterium]|jgi:putative membrane protein|nr:DUF4142 domain-containing protein [Blastocatellia bacterium]